MFKQSLQNMFVSFKASFAEGLKKIGTMFSQLQLYVTLLAKPSKQVARWCCKAVQVVGLQAFGLCWRAVVA